MCEEYAARAPLINQKFLTISDHGMLGAVPRQIKACDKINDKMGKDTLSPIFACELYLNSLQPESSGLSDMQKFMADLNEDEKKECRTSSHLLAIAYNEVGYKNLVRLSSWGWTKGFYRKPRVNYEQLLKHKEGLYFTSCCYNSEVGRAFDKHGEEAAFAMIERYIEMFGKEHYLLEIMLLDFEKQKPYDAFIIKAKEKYGLKLILTNDCFVKDTMIATNHGPKPIQDIIQNDLVLTHSGQFRRVIETNMRPLNGEKIYQVNATRGSYAFKATGNHPVYTRDNSLSEWTWTSVDKLKKGQQIQLVRPNPEDIFSSEDLMFIDLDKICGNNINKYYKQEHNSYITYRGTDKRNKVEVPRLFPITDDLLKVIGLYLAEGSVYSKSEVSFATHIREEQERFLIVEYFSQFGINASNDVRGINGMATRFSSVVFKSVLEFLCGKGSTEKYLPGLSGIRFSSRQMAVIIQQYINGDGHHAVNKKYPSLMIPTTSLKLCEGVRLVLAAWGIPVARTERNYKNSTFKHKNLNAVPENWNNLYVLNFSGKRLKALLKKLSGSDELFDFDFTAKVKSIKTTEYDGFVYNFQVETDETYTANGWAVHNCHYCQAEDSHFQRLMLMVQTGRTLNEIKTAMDQDQMQDFFELQDSNLWMKSEEELNAKWEKDYKDIVPYEFFCEAKRTTVEICNQAKGIQLDRSLKLPVLPDADETLKEEVMRGFQWRGLPRSREYLDRIIEEYSLITRKGFSSYFLIQKKMTDEARRVCKELLGFGDGSQAVGPGRGSAAGALTCYCLGITNVDPVYEGLLFSRFMSEARGGRSIVLEFKNMDPLPAEEVFSE